MQSLCEAGERVSVSCPRAQGLSRKAHAFSVEALVGKSSKRMKIEKAKDKKIEESDYDLDTSTGTVVNTVEDSGERVLILTVCVCELTVSAGPVMLANSTFLQDSHKTIVLLSLLVTGSVKTNYPNFYT